VTLREFRITGEQIIGFLKQAEHLEVFASGKFIDQTISAFVLHTIREK
jgi:hypothetical protein